MTQVLGMPYDFGIDTWSIGCTLFELYTGKILFTGRSNNQMLRAIMETRGKFSHKMLRKAEFAAFHFDDLLNFRSVEKDKLTGKVSNCLMTCGLTDKKLTCTSGRCPNFKLHQADSRSEDETYSKCKGDGRC